MKVAAYCRTASAEYDYLKALAALESYCKEKIDSNPEWENAGIFSDREPAHEGLEQMFNACREERIDLILVKSVSRFGRNLMEVMETVRKLKEINVGVVFEKENLVTHTVMQ